MSFLLRAQEGSKNFVENRGCVVVVGLSVVVVVVGVSTVKLINLIIFLN